MKIMTLKSQNYAISSALLKSVFAIAGSLVIALGAQVSVPIPFSVVPLSLQTLAVFMVIALLGAKVGTVSIFLYLLEGMAGFPVFALGAGGFYHLAGPTGGYLVAFLPLGFLFGQWLDTVKKPHFFSVACISLLCHAAILFLGALWLSRYIPWQAAMMNGIAPFVPGEIVKSLILTAFVTGFLIPQK